MRIKRIAALLFAAVLILTAGCTGQNGDVGTLGEDERTLLTVYYAMKPDKQTTGELIKPVDIELEEGADLLHAALSFITEDPDSQDCVSAFPKSVKINSYTLTDGVLTVNFNGSYSTMDPMAKTVARGCLVLTLCALEEVGYVSIFVDGSPVDEMLNADMMVLPDSDGDAYERQLTLYFPDSQMDFLYSEKRILTIGQDKSVCVYVLEELCRGPQESNLLQSLPEGTSILSVEQTGSICTVDLSREFYTNKPSTAGGERMALYSIVNSLCAINGVEAVQILIDGERYEKYLHVDLKAPLKGEPLLEYDSFDTKNDLRQTLFLRLQDGRLVEFPIMVDREKYLTQEESALRELMSVPNPCGYQSPISGSVDLISVSLENRVCTAVFDERLLIAGSSERRNRTLEAIANTILSCGSADSVIIMAGSTPAEKALTLDMTNVVE